MGESSVKIIKWNSKALEYVRLLDDKTKREIGTLLMLVQSGKFLSEPQSKPMKIIHRNAHELRIKDMFGTYRVIYILNIKGTIFIPHAFGKNTQKTPHREINLAIQRLQEFLNENK
jgi:phage-related protein